MKIEIPEDIRLGLFAVMGFNEQGVEGVATFTRTNVVDGKGVETMEPLICTKAGLPRVIELARGLSRASGVSFTLVGFGARQEIAVITPDGAHVVKGA